MSHLSLVKSLSHLQEEQKHSEEILIERVGLSFTRGSVAEISGSASSGKTSMALTILSQLTRKGEVCAIVDSTGNFDPCTAVFAGVELDNLLWIRCGGNVEKAFMSTDYLVQAKGFGAIWLNLCGLPERELRMVPKTYWYRYRTRIKETPTLLIVTSSNPVTSSASQSAFVFSRESTVWSGTGKFKLLREFGVAINARKGSYGQPYRTRIEMDYTPV